MNNLKKILTIVSEVSGVSEDAIMSKSRVQDTADARCLFLALAGKSFQCCDREVANFVGRERTIVIYSRQKFTDLCGQQYEPFYTWAKTVSNRLKIDLN
jgi:chromosomal replication initiation ATPase DnaA